LSIGFGTGQNSHRGDLIFASNIQGKLTNTFHWPIAQVMAILKLASSGNCKTSIANVGALQNSHNLCNRPMKCICKFTLYITCKNQITSMTILSSTKTY
jgi:hypothetical protein